MEEDEVNPNAKFIEDLGADSLDTVELVMAFEEEFDIEIPDEDAEKIATVGDAITYIKENSVGAEADRRGERGASSSPGSGRSRPSATRAEEFWTSLLEGVSGIGPITRFDTTGYPTRIAGELKGFDPLQVHRQEGRPEARPLPPVRHRLRGDGGGGRRARRRARSTARASACSSAPASAGSRRCSRPTTSLNAKGPDRVSPFFIPMLIVNMASGLVSMRFGAKGPNSSVVTACATGNHAIGDAMRIIQRGDADVMIAGGAEAIIIPLTIAGFCQMKAMSTRNDEPGRRPRRPFDAEPRRLRLRRGRRAPGARVARARASRATRASTRSSSATA